LVLQKTRVEKYILDVHRSVASTTCVCERWGVFFPRPYRRSSCKPGHEAVKTEMHSFIGVCPVLNIKQKRHNRFPSDHKVSLHCNTPHLLFVCFALVTQPKEKASYLSVSPPFLNFILATYSDNAAAAELESVDLRWF